MLLEDVLFPEGISVCALLDSLTLRLVFLLPSRLFEEKLSRDVVLIFARIQTSSIIALE